MRGRPCHLRVHVICFCLCPFPSALNSLCCFCYFSLSQKADIELYLILGAIGVAFLRTRTLLLLIPLCADDLLPLICLIQWFAFALLCCCTRAFSRFLLDGKERLGRVICHHDGSLFLAPRSAVAHRYVSQNCVNLHGCLGF